MLKRSHALMGSLWLLLPTADAALALEYCVTCVGPPAIYRCVIEGTEDGPGRDQSASLHCISQMAKRGGHETCSASRGAPFPCPGLTSVVTEPRALPRDIPSPDEAGLEQPHPAEATASDPAEPAPPAKKKVPRTMEELAGDTVRSSQQGLKTAGDAIGGTAKKAGEQIGNAGTALGSAATQTWTCITSLFSSCSNDETVSEAPIVDDATAN
ncbi:hypothetical protein [Hyphomicrobium sp. CS1GBMeth3]|uniref:hypothetical protein n=1 Tax=Hyphomicrobium sp. CS1GBMeth3 TaxID=1892845 RepID=UPI000931A913|nr:hypothetical protein [Hyphomicrobium sp. CS1GBMeth3]